jgi:hypothetical protein
MELDAGGIIVLIVGALMIFGMLHAIWRAWINRQQWRKVAVTIFDMIVGLLLSILVMTVLTYLFQFRWTEQNAKLGGAIMLLGMGVHPVIMARTRVGKSS